MQNILIPNPNKLNIKLRMKPSKYVNVLWYINIDIIDLKYANIVGVCFSLSTVHFRHKEQLVTTASHTAYGWLKK